MNLDIGTINQNEQGNSLQIDTITPVSGRNSKRSSRRKIKRIQRESFKKIIKLKEAGWDSRFDMSKSVLSTPDVKLNNRIIKLRKVI